MLSKIRDRKGFTLIELMIVVAIIAILAAIAIPNFLKFQAKSKQSEARTVLTGVYEAELAYFATENYFSTDVTDIGFETASPPKYYLMYPGYEYDHGGAGATAWIVVTDFTGDGLTDSFTASCSGNIDRDADRDIWFVHDGSREPSQNDTFQFSAGNTANNDV